MAVSRVVIINDSFAGRGGATDVAVAEALILIERGIHVTLISGDHGDNPALEGAGLELIALGERPILEMAPIEGGIRGLYNRRAAKTLADWIEKNDTETTVYHLHNWSHILSPSIFTPLRRVHRRLVISLHDYFIACPNGGYLNYRTDAPCPLTPLSAQCLGTNCDRRNYAHKLWRVARQALRKMLFDPRIERPVMLTLHERMAPYLLRADVPEDSLLVLRNPITPFRAERIAAERNDVFVFVGRLEREKGPDLAAEAVKQAGGKLRFIGEGPMRAEMERRYPQFEFSGWQTPDKIGPLLHDARALIMSSRVPEPFGMAAVQALWSGLPVIATAHALLASEIVESGAGLSWNPGEAGALTACIQQLMTDDAMAAAMSQRAYASTGHLGNTPKQWADRLLAILDERLLLAAAA